MQEPGWVLGAGGENAKFKTPTANPRRLPKQREGRKCRETLALACRNGVTGIRCAHRRVPDRSAGPGAVCLQGSVWLQAAPVPRPGGPEAGVSLSSLCPHLPRPPQPQAPWFAVGRGPLPCLGRLLSEQPCVWWTPQHCPWWLILVLLPTAPPYAS
uniref:Uncharacterized protein n=1 Tax=Pipistrellus kuhlii TaxID=59472 RepID=A0A7J7VMB4_PIPKU|nr:hypothetical protein mPipKuh1_008368 [Pipistrellus kuhlii]